MGQVARPHRSLGEKWTRQAYVIEGNINPQIAVHETNGDQRMSYIHHLKEVRMKVTTLALMAYRNPPSLRYDQMKSPHSSRS